MICQPGMKIEPYNIEFDLTPGDYVVADVPQLDGNTNPKSKKKARETLKVVKMYPYIFECMRTNGKIINLIKTDYVCGLVKRASDSDAASFDRMLKRSDSLCKTNQ